MNRHFDKHTGRMAQIGLSQQVRLREMWPTPTKSCGTGASEHGTGGLNIQTAVKLWPTPRAHEVGDYTRDHGQKGMERPTLTGAVKLWPTPRLRGLCGGTGHLQMLQAKLGDEEGRKFFNGGQLNPTWVEWLMGYPLAWTDLRAESVTKCQRE